MLNETIILYVVLYECETWSLTLRKEYMLRVGVAGNRKLGIIFGQKLTKSRRLAKTV
jgi:hypothetical protein